MQWTEAALETLAAFANGQGLGRLFIEKWGVTWDSVTDDYSIDDIDADTVRQFVRLSKARLPYITEDEPIESLLHKLDLIVEGKLTRGAIMLFGKDPQRHFLMTQVHMGRFKTATTIVDDKLVRGNLFQQLELESRGTAAGAYRGRSEKESSRFQIA